MAQAKRAIAQISLAHGEACGIAVAGPEVSKPVRSRWRSAGETSSRSCAGITRQYLSDGGRRWGILCMNESSKARPCAGNCLHSSPVHSANEINGLQHHCCNPFVFVERRALTMPSKCAARVPRLEGGGDPTVEPEHVRQTSSMAVADREEPQPEFFVRYLREAAKWLSPVDLKPRGAAIERSKAPCKRWTAWQW